MLASAMVNGVVLSNGFYLTAEHGGKHFVLSDDRHAWPPNVNKLENAIEAQSRVSKNYKEPQNSLRNMTPRYT
jgi:hypothetical protein